MAWMQTLTGKAFDLSEPSADMVDFAGDVAPALGKLARFAGHTNGPPYSVAQHCVIGAACVFQDTKSHRLAKAFLLHDAHEAYIGDITTPVSKTIATAFVNDDFSLALSYFKARLDRAIHKAADFLPLTSAEHAIVREWDLRMMVAERDALMAPSPKDWECKLEPAPVNVLNLAPWPYDTAAAMWLQALTFHSATP